MQEAAPETEQEAPDYPVTVFLSAEGYLKKIKTANLRLSGEQKLKEGDTMLREEEASNRDELLFFTNHHQVYKSRLSDFEDGKASQLGEYVAGKLEMEEDEQPVYMALLHEYKGYMLFAFENGQVRQSGCGCLPDQDQPQEALECLFCQVTLGGGYVYSGGYGSGAVL